MNYYDVNIVNLKKNITVDENTTLYDLSKIFNKSTKGQILCGKVNGEIEHLDYKISGDCNIEFFDITSSIGFRVYQRSCMFVMLVAANEVLGENKVVWVEHTMNGNYYCKIDGKYEITGEDVQNIKSVMQDIIQSEYTIEKISVSLNDGIKIFKQYNLTHRIKALKYLNRSEITLYKLKNFYDYLYGAIVPNTSYIKYFDIEKCGEGFLLRFEDPKNPCNLNTKPVYPKLMNIFKEHSKWSRILNTDTVYSLNDSIVKNEFKQNILVAEALHEKKIAEIVDIIHSKNKKIVMIAGPSSSGKTTFSKRLAIQMRVIGKNPQVISLDDYYKNRADVPIEADGERNFEKLSSIDVEKFNDDMTRLLKGEKVETPLFDFLTGNRKKETKSISLNENEVLIIEGIHGINEELSYSIPSEYKFKIYISALTQLNIDEHNRISTTDARLIRRLVRDNHFRGVSARETLSMWHKVMAGEEENIYPFQEQADIMFNSSLIYELSVLKTYVEPLLFEIEKGETYYSEAKRLLNMMNCFIGVDSKYIPPNSLLREFIGDSCFD